MGRLHLNNYIITLETSKAFIFPVIMDCCKALEKSGAKKIYEKKVSMETS